MRFIYIIIFILYILWEGVRLRANFGGTLGILGEYEGHSVERVYSKDPGEKNMCNALPQVGEYSFSLVFSSNWRIHFRNEPAIKTVYSPFVNKYTYCAHILAFWNLNITENCFSSTFLLYTAPCEVEEVSNRQYQ